MSYKVSRGGLLTALSLIILLLSGIFPNLTLSLSALAGFVIAVTVLEMSYREGWLVFFAVSVLAFIILPRREAVLAFCGFFGYYPIIRGYIMMKRSIWLRLFLKLFIMNSAMLVLGVLSIKLFMSSFNVVLWQIIGLVLGANVVFLIYDKVLEGFLTFYSLRIGGRQ